MRETAAINQIRVHTCFLNFYFRAILPLSAEPHVAAEACTAHGIFIDTSVKCKQTHALAVALIAAHQLFGKADAFQLISLAN